jgi:endonuclease/exonuclease/phosphatase family metal-dependent hydrolase
MRFYFWLLILFSFGAGEALAQARPGKKEKAGAALRVMTYNIRLATTADSSNYWPYRKDRVAGLIRYHHPDLLGVQEALAGQIADLDAALADFTRYGVGRDDGQQKGEFSAIYFRKSRFQKLDAGTFWLSEQPQQPGSKSWDAAITRICSWVKLKDLQTGQVFFHFNTHFDHRGQVAREKSAQLILDQIRRLAGTAPVILTGDFNVPPASPAYQTLVTNTGFQDARALSQHPPYGPDGSFSGFRVNRPLQARIDFIFVNKPIRVLQHAILTDQQGGYYPSDHLPVVAELLLR